MGIEIGAGWWLSGLGFFINLEYPPINRPMVSISMHFIVVLSLLIGVWTGWEPKPGCEIVWGTGFLLARNKGEVLQNKIPFFLSSKLIFKEQNQLILDYNFIAVCQGVWACAGTL